MKRSEAERLDKVILHTNAYHKTGTDCVFIPGVSERSVIKLLVHSISSPLNLLIGPKTPSVASLRKLGVTRLSVGSGPMRAAMGLTRRIAEELRGPGTYGSISEHEIPYSEMNKLLSRDSE